ncbi:hypothetical protein ncot_11585 [Nocardioides sp. JQ2195]|uniref:hypothetical protein n=1 Tax=Nocardioides sp. JQ2195 TaxID=2592334 RepID=UPI00143E363D|nr:hypothetical protein [Nocardioides sp. JQ2195]QIX27169.1 hypothetical protein ncot_11585 [Nocardioides sp. JQ2195]
MSSHTVVATANVHRGLGAADARRALDEVLEQEPDLIGLQEWHPWRARLLLATGRVGLARGRRVGQRIGRQNADHFWTMPVLGDCVVGARRDRFTLDEARVVPLSRPARADKPERWLGIEPPHFATVAVYDDHVAGRRVSLVNYHLVPGVQARGRYRDDRPLLVARHQHEVRRVQRLVDEQLALGHTTYAVGDSNFDGLRLDGLTSAWEGRDDQPGTLGPRRKVDDVFGPGPAVSVRLLENASDHKAVLVQRPD